MNELEYFLALEASNRQTGRTTAQAKACMEAGGIYVCATEAQKRHVKQMFPDLQVATLGEKTALIGTNKPVLLDHFAWKQILLNYDMESKQQRVEIQEMRRKILKVKKIISELEV